MESSKKLVGLLFVALLFCIGIATIMFWAGRLHERVSIMQRYDQWIEHGSDTDVRIKCYIFTGDSTHKNCIYH